MCIYREELWGCVWESGLVPGWPPILPVSCVLTSLTLISMWLGGPGSPGWFSSVSQANSWLSGHGLPFPLPMSGWRSQLTGQSDNLPHLHVRRVQGVLPTCKGGATGGAAHKWRGVWGGAATGKTEYTPSHRFLAWLISAFNVSFNPGSYVCSSPFWWGLDQLCSVLGLPHFYLLPIF